MKEYLQLFRDQAFNGAFALMKRILVPNILITILLSIISAAVIVPLLMQAVGWGIADLMEFKDKMKNMPKEMTTPDEMKEFFLNMFGPVNFGYLAIAGVLMILFSAYQYVVFFKLNDNEVRNGNTSFADAMKASLSSKIFAMLGLYFMIIVLMVLIFLVYGALLAGVFMASKALGVLVAFLLFFVVVILIIRLLIAPAALIHGDMGIWDSITFSFRKITWKRAGILLLMGLVFLIAMMMVSGLISSITVAIFGVNTTSTTSFALSQILSSIIGAVLNTFMYSAMTAIYFRYSDDELPDNGQVEEHLIS